MLLCSYRLFTSNFICDTQAAPKRFSFSLFFLGWYLLFQLWVIPVDFCISYIVLKSFQVYFMFLCFGLFWCCVSWLSLLRLPVFPMFVFSSVMSSLFSLNPVISVFLLFPVLFWRFSFSFSLDILLSDRCYVLLLTSLDLFQNSAGDVLGFVCWIGLTSWFWSLPDFWAGNFAIFQIKTVNYCC